MLATIGDNQIFGMDPILKTVEPVKMIRNFRDKPEAVRKAVMTQLIVWNPKDQHLVEKPNARS